MIFTNDPTICIRLSRETVRNDRLDSKHPVTNGKSKPTRGLSNQSAFGVNTIHTIVEGRGRSGKFLRISRSSNVACESLNLHRII